MALKALLLALLLSRVYSSALPQAEEESGNSIDNELIDDQISEGKVDFDEERIPPLSLDDVGIVDTEQEVPIDNETEEMDEEGKSENENEGGSNMVDVGSTETNEMEDEDENVNTTQNDQETIQDGDDKTDDANGNGTQDDAIEDDGNSDLDAIQDDDTDDNQDSNEEDSEAIDRNSQVEDFDGQAQEEDESTENGGDGITDDDIGGVIVDLGIFGHPGGGYAPGIIGQPRGICSCPCQPPQFSPPTPPGYGNSIDGFGPNFHGSGVRFRGFGPSFEESGVNFPSFEVNFPGSPRHGHAGRPRKRGGRPDTTSRRGAQGTDPFGGLYSFGQRFPIPGK